MVPGRAHRCLSTCDRECSNEWRAFGAMVLRSGQALHFICPDCWESTPKAERDRLSSRGWELEMLALPARDGVQLRP